ncbi:uncharacterized protein K444DRAFT_477344, partial [Hyaloscypha bicolor E]
ARYQIMNTLNTRNNLSITNIYKLPLNSNILVYNWDGLYKLVAINGKNYILALLYSNTTFYLISIKPFY